jgi:surfeit locus 1 family protein
MRLKSVLIALAVVVAAAVCVRLGFWQLGRWTDKRRLNARAQALLAEPARRLAAASAPVESAAGRKLVISGRYDESRQLLLIARFHDGEPGVELVTPVCPDSGPAVLVDRGWLPAADGTSARPRDYPEPGPRVVTGVGERIERGAAGAALRRAPSDSGSVLVAEALDLDSVAARLPYPIAPWLLRQLPGPGVPTLPLRTAPQPLNESMHLGYAIQWFGIAVILLVGGTALARSRRHSRSTQ